MTAPVPALGDERVNAAGSASLERLARLRDGVRGIGRRGPSNLDRPMLIAGGVLLPLGIVLIVLGWYGAAHTARLFEQIPYAISGGLLGVALVLAGGFLYFGAWLSQLVADGRRQSEQLTGAIGRLEEQLAALAGTRAPVEATGGNETRSATSAGLVATANGTMVHRPDCAVVANKSGLREVGPDAAGYKPCKICEPFS